ncbi:MAG: hypothetical protein ACE5OY_04080 [Candidatus Bathyarchaeia archaeon]
MRRRKKEEEHVIEPPSKIFVEKIAPSREAAMAKMLPRKTYEMEREKVLTFTAKLGPSLSWVVILFGACLSIISSYLVISGQLIPSGSFTIISLVAGILLLVSGLVLMAKG